MKKKMITASLAVLLLLALLFPFGQETYRDGGTKVYTAVLYEVTLHHALHEENGRHGFIAGTTVKILSFTVYSETRFEACE